MESNVGWVSYIYDFVAADIESRFPTRISTVTPFSVNKHAKKEGFSSRAGCLVLLAYSIFFELSGLAILDNKSCTVVRLL